MKKKKKFIKAEDVITYENLYHCFQKCANGKRERHHVIIYQQEAPVRLLKLYRKLRDGKYKARGDYIFYVFEPKKRKITANRFEDKIVQRLLSDYVLEPLLMPRLVNTNCATQPGKGTDFGLHMLTKHLHSYYNNYGVNGYVLQCDISKFFDNIDRSKLINMLQKLPMDEALIDLQRKIICRSNPNSNKGLCIGYQCSQWYAIYYLDKMDHYIKEVLKIKYYGRYMDDFYLIHPDKEYLKYCLSEIARIVEDLGLTLNSKTSIFPIKNGITFLGFRQRLTNTGKAHIMVKKKSIQRERRRLKKYRKLYDEGKITTQSLLDSLQSYHAHIARGNCQSSIHEFDMYFAEMFDDLIYAIPKQEKKKHKLDKMIGDELVIYPRDKDGFFVLTPTETGLRKIELGMKN